MANSTVDDENLFRTIDEDIQNLGRTNIIIVGRSGVGKSTLINSIFKKDLAEASDGSPVTQNITEYPLSDTQISLIDTRGLEMQEYKTTVDLADQFIRKRNDSVDRNSHIHLAWMCISEASHRVEEGEKEFIEMLQKYMPVIIIVTQCYFGNDSFVSKIKDMFPKSKVVCVIAKGRDLRGGITMPTMGLEELTEITEECLPEAHKIAFIAAQQIDFRAKQLKAHGIVLAAASLAVTACAIPVPFAHSIILVPIQMSMITGITNVFGLHLNRSIIMAILGIWGTSSCMSVGEAIAGNLLKFIPGVGSVAGSLISGGVASSITTTFGEGYIRVLNALFVENNGEQPTAEQLILKCKEWKNKQSENEPFELIQ